MKKASKSIEAIKAEAHIEIIAGSIHDLATFLANAQTAKDGVRQLIKEELEGKPVDSPEGRALAASITALLVGTYKWKQQTASDFLVKNFGLRQRAERSDKGNKEEGASGIDADTLAALIAIATDLVGEDKAADALRAASLSAKATKASK